MKTGKFQLFKSKKNSQYYWRLRAKNNEIILQSEGYKTKQSAENGIESVRKNAPIDEQYNRLNATNGQYYFVLTAANNQVIGVSETYTTKAARENGIEAVKQEAPCAPLEDLTEGDQRQDTAKTVGAAETSGGLLILPKSKKCDDGLHVKPKGGVYGTA